MTDSFFTDISTFVRMPRVTGLTTSRSGMAVATRRVVAADGATFVDQLFEVTPQGARQLTYGDTSTSLLAVGDRGEVYFARKDPGAEEKGDAIWMLPPSGEAREIFRHRGGVDAIAVSDTNLLITVSVVAEVKGESTRSAAEALSASADLVKKRHDTKVSAILHERYPTRFWSEDIGPGEARLFVAPLPPLTAAFDPMTGVPEVTPTDKQSADKQDAKAAPVPRTSELELTAVSLPPRPAGVH